MNLRMKCVAVRTEGMNAARENISQWLQLSFMPLYIRMFQIIE
jgi:hypothetical protein